jgi:hypothetical protein
MSKGGSKKSSLASSQNVQKIDKQTEAQIKAIEERAIYAENKIKELQSQVEVLLKEKEYVENVRSQSRILEEQIVLKLKKEEEEIQRKEEIKAEESQAPKNEVASDELLTQYNKSEYRIKFLLRYIDELEANVAKTQTDLKKRDYRILFLLRHIEELESSSNGYTADTGSRPVLDPKSSKTQKPKEASSESSRATVETSSVSKPTKTHQTSSVSKPTETHQTSSVSKPTETHQTSSVSKSTETHQKKPKSTSSDSTTNVTFHWPYGGKKIFIAGTFTHWDQIDIKETFNLSPGTYEYKFNVDGRWCYDMSKPVRDDGFSGFNNVIHI